MKSYIIKSKKLNTNSNIEKISIGNFYSGDRFYTLLNEYININLKKRNIFMSWIIMILFKSSNFKHDPNIANGQPFSVRLFDWICIICLIIFICLALSSLGTLIPIVIKLIQAKPSDEILELKSVLIGLGIPGIVTGIPAILWLWVYFAVRKKNKPLTLQAFVEKKLQFCLNLRFLIKNVDIPHIQKNKEIIILENFESQGTYAPRWLNIQIINVVCSIFPDFNYVFKFNNLSNEEYDELIKVMNYDFRNIELITNEISNIKEWNLSIKKSNKFPFIKTKNNS